MLPLQVLANFGRLPFTSDFTSLQSDAVQQLQAEIEATSVALSGKVKRLIQTPCWQCDDF